MRKYIFILLLFLSLPLVAQQDSLVLDFNEYLGYVKKHHPIAKQAALTISVGQANLMKARGGFDPNLEFDYEGKEFKELQYWNRLNATFKVPTYYGIEFKGGFQKAEGVFINPDETFPEDGLYSVGVSLSLAKGFLINERMATLKKAKFFRSQAKADQDLLVNNILFKASLAYFDWLQAYNDTKIFEDFLNNAKTRFKGVKKSAAVGQVAAIDTIEAKIALQNRVLSLEQAKIKFIKKSLKLANFLWIDDVPLELQNTVIPNIDLEEDIDKVLEIEGKPLNDFTLENHPKLKSLNYKIDGLTVDKKLKANKLLPQIDVEYNFITESPTQISSFNSNEYKAGVIFKYPIFTRKERGDLKIAKFKLQDAKFERDNAQIEIQNKVFAIYRELDSYVTQNQLINSIVADYNTLLSAEERKFSFGESSLFLINSRESKLIDAQIKQNKVLNNFFKTKANLFKILAVNPQNL